MKLTKFTTGKEHEINFFGEWKIIFMIYHKKKYFVKSTKIIYVVQKFLGTL